MSFPFKHVLLIGATAGIGQAMAHRFISEGVKVTAVGRRQERLDQFIAQHGSDKASGLVFDIANLDGIPDFVETVAQAHPSIDCVFLNAGTQSCADFSKPDTVDLNVFHREITINFTSFVTLVHAFLPHLLKHPEPASLVFTGTQVTLIPAFVMPAYCSSKAALESFILCLREQMRDTNVKVMHISPGPVRTELHDNAMGKDTGSKFGMALTEFVDQAYTGLAEGKADIYPGTVGGSTKEQFLELVEKRDEAFARLSGLLRGMH
ncbi:oxidoreductase [Cucurbitaria berberidis CBS 394.84]|uniref:Oxidoreductase n=1 Tax=Cucurbitaria berberidis CBS 394.84 TaxID=1168544 RepID=A0A9P4GGJ2_9PLEO|nr:oxidoreductase [Cucurbitaria berberidis CBS 394.84]KAF1845688.1 oxidoreductase [Cucurbitaria berberidis CBS 394.84]